MKDRIMTLAIMWMGALFKEYKYLKFQKSQPLICLCLLMLGLLAGALRFLKICRRVATTLQFMVGIILKE